MWATYEMSGVSHHKLATSQKMSTVKGLNGAEWFEWML